MKNDPIEHVVLAALRAPRTIKQTAAVTGASRCGVRYVITRMLKLGVVEFAGYAPATLGAQPALYRLVSESAQIAKPLSRAERVMSALPGTARQLSEKSGISEACIRDVLRALGAEVRVVGHAAEHTLNGKSPSIYAAAETETAAPKSTGMRYDLTAPPAGNAELSAAFFAKIPMAGTPWAGLGARA